MVGNSSDPVQLYLTQMSSTPLLNRQQEVEAAQRIEHTREIARRAMLATDYVLQMAASLLEKVAERAVPGSRRSAKGSVSSDEHRRRLTALIAANVATLRDLLQAEPVRISPRRCRGGGRWPSAASFAGRCLARRAKAIRLVEETPIRRQHLQAVLEKAQGNRSADGDRRGGVGPIAP